MPADVVCRAGLRAGGRTDPAERAPASPRARSGCQHVRQGWSGRGRGSDPPSPSSPRPRSAGFLCHKSLFEGPSAGRPGSGGQCPEPMQRAPPGSGSCSGGRAAGTDSGGGAPETVAARPRAGVCPFSRARRPLCRRDRAVGAVCEDLPGRQERQACSRPGPSPGPSAVCSHPTEVSSERCAHGDMSTREGRPHRRHRCAWSAPAP